MKLYQTPDGLVLEKNEAFYSLKDLRLDQLLCADDPAALITAQTGDQVDSPAVILAPIDRQEVWAAGVTYFRSRTARMEESEDAGGATFYDKVYDAERPELFFKANPHHVVGPGGAVRIRKDSTWNVPEPELTLCISRSGNIVGYTIGNDMSSRSIEGENPLYLPQAKTYDQAAALGPCILLHEGVLPADTPIRLQIEREGEIVFSDETAVDQMKRSPQELVGFLTRENSFPHGAFLMTGTGIIPDNDFTLSSGDVVSITIDPIGTLTNIVG